MLVAEEDEYWEESSSTSSTSFGLRTDSARRSHQVRRLLLPAAAVAGPFIHRRLFVSCCSDDDPWSWWRGHGSIPTRKTEGLWMRLQLAFSDISPSCEIANKLIVTMRFRIYCNLMSSFTRLLLGLGLRYILFVDYFETEIVLRVGYTHLLSLTELTLLWEYATRYAKTVCGILGYTESKCLYYGMLN